MNTFRKIMVPIDLSDGGRAPIDLATNLAKGNDAKLVFIYVALPPLPRQAAYYKNEMDALILKSHGEFKQIKPTDISVDFEHVFERGNPGPDIVRVAREQDCDLIVLGTHGRRGFSRLLMGSVAEYIVRNAHCPVLTLKEPAKGRKTEAAHEHPEGVQSPFITSAMQHVEPIQKEDQMADVCRELAAAKSSAAPIVDHTGKCIGILTNTDIKHYQELKRRFEDQDPTVIPEVFETDDYGLRRTNSIGFDQVVRHMTSPVITISVRETCHDAWEKFEANPSIHHLVVLDENERPLGVVEPQQLDQLGNWNVDRSISLDKSASDSH